MKKTSLWQSLVLIYVFAIFALLPLTPRIVELISRHIQIEMFVGGIFFTVFLAAAFYASRKKSVRRLRFSRNGIVILAVFIGLLAICVMKIKLAVERIHILEYAILYFLLYRSSEIPADSNDRAFKCFALASSIGALDEAVQAILPNRFFAWKDIWFNVLGSGVGWMVYRLVKQSFEKKVGSVRWFS